MQSPDRIGAKALLPVTLIGDVDAEGRCIVQIDCGTHRIEVPYKALRPAEGSCQRGEPPAWPDGFSFCERCGTRSDMPCPARNTTPPSSP